MTDAITSTVAVNVATASLSGAGVVIFGLQTGLDPQMLMAGFAGGASALSYSAPAKPLIGFFQVCTATILAGYASPFLTAFVAYNLHKWGLQPSEVPLTGAQLLTAFMVAYLAHGVLPGIRKVASTLLRRFTRD